MSDQDLIPLLDRSQERLGKLEGVLDDLRCTLDKILEALETPVSFPSVVDRHCGRVSENKPDATLMRAFGYSSPCQCGHEEETHYGPGSACIPHNEVCRCLQFDRGNSAA